MADVIMTFTYRAVGMLPYVTIPVAVEGTIGKIDMLIGYNTNTRDMAIHRIGENYKLNENHIINYPVKTPLGLVKQANASFKYLYGNNSNTPVLHVKSFRKYADRSSYPTNVFDYEIQDLTRIQDLFDYVASVSMGTVGNASAGKSIPISCSVVDSNVSFYNIYTNPVNPIVGVDVSHGDRVFRKSMIANGFTLIP